MGAASHKMAAARFRATRRGRTEDSTAWSIRIGEQLDRKRTRSRRSEASRARKRPFCRQPPRFPRPIQPAARRASVTLAAPQKQGFSETAEIPRIPHHKASAQKTHEQKSTSQRHPNHHIGDHSPAEFQHKLSHHSSPVSDLGEIAGQRRLHGRSGLQTPPPPHGHADEGFGPAGGASWEVGL